MTIKNIEELNKLNLSEITSLSDMVEVFNASYGLTGGISKAMEKRKNDLLKAANAAHVTAYFDKFVEELNKDTLSGWMGFINKPDVTVERVSWSEKDGVYKNTQTKRQISFLELEACFQLSKGTFHADGSVEPDSSATLAVSKRYHAMLSYLVDNTHRHKAGMLSDGSEQERKVVTCAVRTQGGDTERKEFNFSGCSLKDIAYQMDAMLRAIIPGTHKNFRRCDAYWFVDVMHSQDVRTTTTTTANEKKAMLAFFSAARKSLNREAYHIKSKADVHKQPKTGPEEKAIMRKC